MPSVGGLAGVDVAGTSNVVGVSATSCGNRERRSAGRRAKLAVGDGGGVATASGVAAASGAAMTGSAAGDKIWKRYPMGDTDLDDEAIGEVDEDRAELRGELWAL